MARRPAVTVEISHGLYVECEDCGRPLDADITGHEMTVSPCPHCMEKAAEEAAEEARNEAKP